MRKSSSHLARPKHMSQSPPWVTAAPGCQQAGRGPAWGSRGLSSSTRLASWALGKKKRSALLLTPSARGRWRLRSSYSAFPAWNLPVCNRGAATALMEGQKPSQPAHYIPFYLLTRLRLLQHTPSWVPQGRAQGSLTLRAIPWRCTMQLLLSWAGKRGQESYVPTLSGTARLCWKQKGCPSAGSCA